LLSHPPLAFASCFRALSRAFAPLRTKFFLKLMQRRSKKRQTALRLPRIPRLVIAATTSSSVKSGCSAIKLRRNSASSSSGEMLPPLGFGATLPVLSNC
jgi:hypothetical protein